MRKRRIQLPSGQTVEIVYTDRPEPMHPTSDPLHICPECRSEMVYPTKWGEEDEHSFRMRRRCPECEWQEEDIFPTQMCSLFDDRIETGYMALVRDYKALRHTNMAEWVESFALALAYGAILPEDF